MTDLITIKFDVAQDNKWADLLLQRSQQDHYGYVVTPNVDHVVNLLDGSIDRTPYDNAELKINDSRILELLAGFVGKSLPATPGSDLVVDLLHHPQAHNYKFAVVGPDSDEFARLSERFPNLNIKFIPSSPKLIRGTKTWDDLVSHIVDLPFDIILVCISFPKQEYLSYDIAQSGRGKGLAICAGASIDFLTGKQKRSPKLFRKFRMEWAFRLMSNPQRFWKRYMLKGPRIFYYFIRYEIF